MTETGVSPSLELTVLSKEPLVAGPALSDLNHEVTPTNGFFIRNHFPIPALDASSWTLTVDGEVQREITLGYDDLKAMPSKEVVSLLECAGNSRDAIQPPIEGLRWDHGGVGTACWKGIPLRGLLEQAGMGDSTTEILLVGADYGTEREVTGELCYARSIPLEKALNQDTILAYEMNGQELTAEHGYPLRALVPGWYGMTSVKWLVGIRALQKPFDGFHQNDYYVFVPEGASDGTIRERVTAMAVKSLITWPGRGHLLTLGKHTIRGVAWSGHGPITNVELTTDNGTNWRPAEVHAAESPFAWRQWEFQWDVQEPGHFLIRARATDQKGNVQPERAPWNFRGFANNSIHAVPVTVRPRA